jgi:NAD+ diphosphatase
MNGHNVFAGAFVDRSGHRRKDAQWLREIFAAPEACFAPVWGGRCLVQGEPPRIAFIGHRQADSLTSPGNVVFLGMFRERPAFAFEIESDEAPFAEAGQFHDLRYLGSVLPPEEANLVAHAIALVNWHRMQKHCGYCGSPMRPTAGGNSLTCASAGCDREIFPRVDPAIIVLVSREDRCLLGRQSSWPEGRYSTLAGFVEPGESLEDAVRREVLEETGVMVGDVRYHSSQPWPFPSSLMLGFVAAAESDGIELVDGELEDARWFTRKECRSGFPKLPFRLSIARRLVDDWLEDS